MVKELKEKLKSKNKDYIVVKHMDKEREPKSVLKG